MLQGIVVRVVDLFALITAKVDFYKDAVYKVAVS